MASTSEVEDGCCNEFCEEAAFFFSTSVVRAFAIMVPACEPRPLLFSMRCRNGTAFSKNLTKGSTVLRPNALSLRLTSLSLSRLRRDVRRESSAGGISERRREVKMSSRLAS